MDDVAHSRDARPSAPVSYRAGVPKLRFENPVALATAPADLDEAKRGAGKLDQAAIENMMNSTGGALRLARARAVHRQYGWFS